MSFLKLRFEGLLKYAVIGLVLLAALTLAVAPFSKSLVEQWARNDVELRSRLAYTSIQGPIVRALADGDEARLATILQGVAEDERILAVGLCHAANLFVRQGCEVGRGKFLEHRQRRPAGSGRVVSDRNA
jgi:hypothetical protein